MHFVWIIVEIISCWCTHEQQNGTMVYACAYMCACIIASSSGLHILPIITACIPHNKHVYVLCIGCFNNLHLQLTITVMMGAHNTPITVMIDVMIPTLSVTSLPATRLIKTSEFCINWKCLRELVWMSPWMAFGAGGLIGPLLTSESSTHMLTPTKLLLFPLSTWSMRVRNEDCMNKEWER